jgi:poly-beta-hydroxyalkanoate depolymerase
MQCIVGVAKISAKFDLCCKIPKEKKKKHLFNYMTHFSKTTK